MCNQLQHVLYLLYVHSCVDNQHRCQPSRFRRDGPEFDCYVPLSRFTYLLSCFLSSAVSAVQLTISAQLDICLVLVYL